MNVMLWKVEKWVDGSLITYSGGIVTMLKEYLSVAVVVLTAVTASPMENRNVT